MSASPAKVTNFLDLMALVLEWLSSGSSMEDALNA